MAPLLKKANQIINLWRDHGPNRDAIDLQTVFREIVLPSSEGDQCTIIYDRFDTFEGLMARLTGHKQWRIGVNLNIQYGPRRNFTLAHEIGHFIGHRYQQDIFECTFDNINDFESAGFESEANEFASHLLMPPDTVRTFASNNVFCHDSVSALASTLGVSRAAAAFRWVKLTNKPVGFVISRDGFIDRGRASDSLYRAGIFFRGGTEVPVGSLATRIREPGHELNETLERVWHPELACLESAFATTQGGYIYSYLNLV